MRPITKMGLGMVVAAALLGATELTLRALDLPDPGLYAGDLSSVWTLRPNLPPREIPFPEEGTTFTVRTNSVGFRGPEAPRGAVVGLDHARPVTTDLTSDGAQRYAQIAVGPNTVRR